MQRILEWENLQGLNFYSANARSAEWQKKNSKLGDLFWVGESYNQAVFYCPLDFQHANCKIMAIVQLKTREFKARTAKIYLIFYAIFRSILFSLIIALTSTCINID